MVREMVIVLMGAPGSGKGTQAANIVKDFDLKHISTGDIFRKNIKENTPLGIKAKSYLNEGKLVPDDIVIEIVADALRAEEQKGYLLDGFPRTVAQAEALENIAYVAAAVNLEMDFDTLLYRISGRRVCEKCGETTHIEFIKEGEKCGCGGRYLQRDDDNEETVKNRLQVYMAQTKPLIDYYKGKGKLINIDSAKNRDVVYKDIYAALKSVI